MNTSRMSQIQHLVNIFKVLPNLWKFEDFINILQACCQGFWKEFLFSAKLSQKLNANCSTVNNDGADGTAM